MLILLTSQNAVNDNGAYTSSEHSREFKMDVKDTIAACRDRFFCRLKTQNHKRNTQRKNRLSEEMPHL